MHRTATHPAPRTIAIPRWAAYGTSAGPHLEINSLQEATKAVVEAARDSLFIVAGPIGIRYSVSPPCPRDSLLRMRLCAALTLVLASGLGQGGEEMPRVGRIVVFGDVRLERKVRQLLPSVPIKLGDAEADKLRQMLAASRSWRQSDLTYVCCESTGTAILYIGVKTTDQHPRFRPTPTGSVRLDSDDLALYDRLMDVNKEAVFKAISQSEDDSAGHALSSYPPERELQEKVIARVGERLALWRDAVLESADGHHRAAAAYLIAYGPKDQMLADLTRTAADSDSLVRNNAVRSFGVLAHSVDIRTHLRLDLTPLINLFQSVHWTDWNKASFALLALTDTGNPSLLGEITRRARDPLHQIAAWPPMHARPGLLILERIDQKKTQGRLRRASSSESRSGSLSRK